MTTVRFIVPLAAAHALLAEAVFARGTVAGSKDPGVEFEDSNSADETQIGCSLPMARFILKELQRIGAQSQHDVELAFALTQAAILVRRAIAEHEESSLA